MTAVVVDTSVIVKWYIPEQHHEEARALRDAYLAGTVDLVAPALMPFEAVNALKYSGHYSGERLEQAAQSLSDYGIELVPFGEIDAVSEMAMKHDITVYDGAYVALAQERDTTAYTADGTLCEDIEGDDSRLVEHIRTYS